MKYARIKETYFSLSEQLFKTSDAFALHIFVESRCDGSLCCVLCISDWDLSALAGCVVPGVPSVPC